MNGSAMAYTSNVDIPDLTAGSSAPSALMSFRSPPAMTPSPHVPAGSSTGPSTTTIPLCSVADPNVLRLHLQGRLRAAVDDPLVPRARFDST